MQRHLVPKTSDNISWNLLPLEKDCNFQRYKLNHKISSLVALLIEKYGLPGCNIRRLGGTYHLDSHRLCLPNTKCTAKQPKDLTLHTHCRENLGQTFTVTYLPHDWYESDNTQSILESRSHTKTAISALSWRQTWTAYRALCTCTCHLLSCPASLSLHVLSICGHHQVHVYLAKIVPLR
jgi:hypothetical protein